jgi:hypothetical protein
MMMVTQKELHEIFEYRDGQLIWKSPTSNRVSVGDVAGTPHPSGYLKICVNGKKYFAHRLIYLFHHGHMPMFLDHIDRNGLNNKIENLREATLSQNSANTSIRSDNTSGYRGVSWDKKAKKWLAKITIFRKQKYLGYFSSPEAAYEVYCEAARNHYGKFANI